MRSQAGTASSAATKYYASRFAVEPKRAVLWRTLAQEFFSKLIRPSDTVLELGAGYCDFVNNIQASRKLAIDVWPGVTECAAPGVESVIGSVTDLSWIGDGEVDFVFASNLFEHLKQDEFAQVLQSVQRILRPGGTLCILQPNYRYCAAEYFDDFTHVAVYSHVSMGDFLKANGYVVTYCHPRFLPLTMKSRLPVWPILIKLYLKLPIRFMGAQMLFLATPQVEKR
jgi:ubiquinone/menaquinone biosynthesis C-methylase UbiE